MFLNRSILGALALTLATLSWNAQAAAKLKEGDPFPDLTTFTFEGTLPAGLKGSVVLVDFWASWCGPCKESFPVMEALHKKYAAQGLVIVAINLDDKKASMDDFMKSHPVEFTVVRDAAKKLVALTGISSMPSSFVLDREGRVVSVHSGFHGDKTAKQYADEIELLLKKPAAKE